MYLLAPFSSISFSFAAIFNTVSFAFIINLLYLSSPIRIKRNHIPLLNRSRSNSSCSSSLSSASASASAASLSSFDSSSSSSTSSKNKNKNQIQQPPRALPKQQPQQQQQWNAWKVGRHIYTTEGGLLAFWRGNTPNVLRQAGGASLNFMLMDWYKSCISSLLVVPSTGTGTCSSSTAPTSTTTTTNTNQHQTTTTTTTTTAPQNDLPRRRGRRRRGSITICSGEEERYFPAGTIFPGTVRLDHRRNRVLSH
mmetsp:Transcript_17861/g.20019  ORF Transcript_17861/g.20019 Transcript_17861/m.20019 type:complete len:252 (-) Transcript_17861:255-1010(-)